MYNFQKLTKFRAPVPIKGIQIVIVFTFLLIISQTYVFLTPYVLCLFLNVESALKVCRSNSNTPVIHTYLENRNSAKKFERQNFFVFFF
jgi:hypothetical protein